MTTHQVSSGRSYSITASTPYAVLREAADTMEALEVEEPGGHVTCDAFSLWYDESAQLWCVGMTVDRTDWFGSA